MAVVVKLGAAQLSRLTFAVKTIDQQDVESVDFAADEICAVGTQNAEMIVVSLS